MNETTYTVIIVYLVGFALSGVVFYNGAVRGKARHSEIWSILFSLFWFVTIPLLVWSVVKSFREDRRGR